MWSSSDFTQGTNTRTRCSVVIRPSLPRKAKIPFFRHCAFHYRKICRAADQNGPPADRSAVSTPTSNPLQSLEICPELCLKLLLASLVTSSFKTQPCHPTATKSFYNTTVNRTIVAVSQVAILLDMAGHQPASKGDVPMVQPYETRQATCFLFASCKPMVRSSADGSTSQRERILRSRG